MKRRAIAFVLLVLGAALAWQAWRMVTLARHGEALFDGRARLEGRLPGHEQALPEIAVRCANCHAPTAPAADASASAADGFGPSLDRAALTEPRSRRGGPPSTYDAASFCAVLRTGIDPASVIVPQTMPRYRIDERDCDALWRHLTSR